MTGIVIPNNGTIGSAGDTDAISIASDGKATLSQKPTFSQGIANAGTIDAGTLGSSVVFPAGNSYYTSDMSEQSSDSGDQTVNTTYGFGTVTGPISLPNNTKIRMHVFGGIVEYDADTEYGSSVNYKTGSTFSSSTDGSFTNAINWTNNQSSKLTSNYINADYNNTSGGAINVYFRQGMKSSRSTTGRWYAHSGNGRIVMWYELIQI